MRRKGINNIIIHRGGIGQGVLHAPYVHEEQTSGHEKQPVEYPDGNYEMSLLVWYEHHVSLHIWYGNVSKSQIVFVE